MFAFPIKELLSQVRRRGFVEGLGMLPPNAGICLPYTAEMSALPSTEEHDVKIVTICDFSHTH
jgi:hypothetical protein